MSSILAIDTGTGSTKALAVDHAGSELFSAQESYPIHHPKQDYISSPKKSYSKVPSGNTFSGKVVAALRNEFGGHAVEKK